MLTPLRDSPLVNQAHGAARDAATLARVTVLDESGIERLRDVEALLIAVWGTSQQAAPLPADLLRSISHAGCNVTAAYDAGGELCGAAVAIVSPGGASTYSLIAGVRPGTADAGVGFALKQHQRAWALDRGYETMTWTFDPLVSRNARFNLTKLGAYADEYEPNFYGVMHDEINTDDESDRLVAVWPLNSERTRAASEGKPDRLELPEYSPRDVQAIGPDGEPMLVEAAGALWCRVPTDIVGLRRRHPSEATAWRQSIRGVLTSAFEAGRSARGVTRTGWYRLDTPPDGTFDSAEFSALHRGGEA